MAITKEKLKGLSYSEKFRLVSQEIDENSGVDDITKYITIKHIERDEWHPILLIKMNSKKLIEDEGYIDNAREEISYIVSKIDEIEEEEILVRYQSDDSSWRETEIRETEIAWEKNTSQDGVEIAERCEDFIGFIVNEYEQVLTALEKGLINISDIKNSRVRDGFTLSHHANISRSGYSELPEKKLANFEKQREIAANYVEQKLKDKEAEKLKELEPKIDRFKEIEKKFNISFDGTNYIGALSDIENENDYFDICLEKVQMTFYWNETNERWYVEKSVEFENVNFNLDEVLDEVAEVLSIRWEWD